MIKTTAKSRALYAKHLNQYVEYENDERTHKDKCFMCEADDVLNEDEGMLFGGCHFCPLNYDLEKIGCTSIYYGWTGEHYFSPFKYSAKARMNWIIAQIHKFTDCVIIDDKEAG